jgi:hypothetical protein
LPETKAEPLRNVDRAVDELSARSRLIQIKVGQPALILDSMRVRIKEALLSESIRIGSAGISRRLLLWSVAAVGSVPVLAMSVDLAWAKMAKTAVAYQDTPHGDQKCSNCKLFEPPSSCKSVEGTISPEGWCKIWVKKAG